MKTNSIFPRLLSLLLVLALCLCIVACNEGGSTVPPGGDTGESGGDTGENGGDTGESGGDTGESGGDTGENGGDTGENGGNTGENEQKPGVIENAEALEQAFAALRAAYEATLAHTGAFTVNAKQLQFHQVGDIAREISVDVQHSASGDGLFFVVYEEHSGEETDFTRIKGFTEGDRFYIFSHYGNNEPEYTFANPGDDHYDDWVSPADAAEESIGGLFLADSYAALLEAYASVYAQISENELALLQQQGVLPADATITLTPTVSIQRNEDGSLALTVSAVGEISGNAEMSDVTLTLDRTIVAKDGRLTELSWQISLQDTQNAGGETVPVKRTIAITYELAEGFDRAGYDAIEVSLPEDESEITPHQPSKSITLVLNEHIETSISFYMPESAEGVLHDLYYHFQWNYTIYDEENCLETVPLTVKGLYLDEARTQPVPEGMTLEQLFALGRLYVDYEIRADYALIEFKREFREEHSTAAQIVFMPAMFGMKENHGPDSYPARPAGETVTLDRTPGKRGEAVTVSVNGVLTEADSLTLAGGEFYFVEYVETETDAQLGLAFLFGVSPFN